MVDSCLSNPCQHGGTCKTEEGGFVCTCTVSYRGTFCNGEFDVNCYHPIKRKKLKWTIIRQGGAKYPYLSVGADKLFKIVDL